MAQIQFKQVLVNNRVVESFENSTDIQLKEHQSERLDTGTITFESFTKDMYNIFDKVKLNDEDGFKWYITDRHVKEKDRGAKRYTHTYQLTELTVKLSKFIVSTLSFDVYALEKSGAFGSDRPYKNLKDALTRVYRLTPFEKVSDLDSTRLWSHKDGTTGVTIEPLLSDKLTELLEAYKIVPEFQFKGSTILEVLTEMLSLIGGAPRLVPVDDQTVMLDIELFKDDDIGEVNITEDDWYDYEEASSADGYGTEVSIMSNNIVDSNSSAEEGTFFGQIIKTDETILDPKNLIIPTTEPIERKISLKIGFFGSSSFFDITDYLVSDEEYKYLDISRGSSSNITTQNALRYTVGKRGIYGLSELTNNGSKLTEQPILKNILEDRGFPTTGDIYTEYRFKFEYVAIQVNNNYKVRLRQGDNNKNTMIPLNNGDRINELDKVVKSAVNKASRAGNSLTLKRVKHYSEAEIHPLGAYDLESGKYIISRDKSLVNDVWDVSYHLTDELNIVHDTVNIDRENRFTDVSRNVDRVETYTDYVTHTLDDSKYFGNFNNTSSLISIENANTLSRVLRLSNRGAINNYWLLSNKLAANPGARTSKNIVIPGTITSSGSSSGPLLNIRMTTNNSRFAGNELVKDTIDGTDVLLTRGAPYTDVEGQLETTGMYYGVFPNTAASYSFDDLTGYPYAESVLFSGSNPEEDGIISIGNSKLNVGSGTFSDTQNKTVSFSVEPSTFGTGDKLTTGTLKEFDMTKDGNATFISLIGVRIDALVRSSFIDDDVNNTDADALQGPTTDSFRYSIDADDYLTIIFEKENAFGGVVEVYRKQYRPSIVQVDSAKLNQGELDTRVIEVDETIQFTIDDDITKLIVKLESFNNRKSKDQVLVTAKTSTIVGTTKTLSDTEFKEDLYLAKNFNEVLTFNYQLQYISLDKELIILDEQALYNDFASNNFTDLDGIKADETNIAIYGNPKRVDEYSKKIDRDTLVPLGYFPAALLTASAENPLTEEELNAFPVRLKTIRSADNKAQGFTLEWDFDEDEEYYRTQLNDPTYKIDETPYKSYVFRLGQLKTTEGISPTGLDHVPHNNGFLDISTSNVYAINLKRGESTLRRSGKITIIPKHKDPTVVYNW